jgi:hypothetical protein
MAVQRPLIYFDGDSAYVELDLINAGHFAQLVGIGERFGWSHPGPSWFYALALFYGPLGAHSWGFVVANLLLNAITVALIVAVVWWSWGPPMALFSGGALLIYVGVMGQQVLRDVWPPDVLIETMLLFLFLSAAGAAGSTPALVGALGVGSYAVQLHLGTGPTVAAVVAAAVGVRLANQYLDGQRASPSRARISSGHWHRSLVWAGLLVLVLMWVPPVVDELTGHPGNMTALWLFFTAEYPKHPYLQAVSVFGRLVTPLEWPRLLTSDISLVSAPFIAIALVFVGLSAGLAATGTLLRDRFAQSIGTIVVVVALAATISIRSVQGHVYGYLLLWVTCLPLVLIIGWIGLIANLQQIRGRVPRLIRERGVAVLGVLVAGLSALSVVAMLTLPPIPNAAPDTLTAWNLTSSALDGQPKQPVLVDIYTPDTWVLAAGVALQLVKDGRPVRVRDDWVFMFGPQARKNGSERFVLAFVDLPDSATYAAQHPGAELIGNTDAHSVFLTRAS